MFTKNTQTGDAGASSHVTSSDTVMYDIMNTDKLVQRRLDNVKASKKGEVQKTVRHVNKNKSLYILWPVEYCKMTREYFLT